VIYILRRNNCAVLHECNEVTCVSSTSYRVVVQCDDGDSRFWIGVTYALVRYYRLLLFNCRCSMLLAGWYLCLKARSYQRSGAYTDAMVTIVISKLERKLDFVVAYFTARDDRERKMFEYFIAVQIKTTVLVPDVASFPSAALSIPNPPKTIHPTFRHTYHTSNHTRKYTDILHDASTSPT